MQAYKFDAKISEEGTISIPFEPSLFGQDVEIIILPKTGVNKEPFSAKKFLEKWSGTIKSRSDEKLDEIKHDYLKGKHQ